LDPPPPPPPSPIEPIEQPTWAAPDPWQRPAGVNVPTSLWDTTDGKEIIQKLRTGGLRTPLHSLFGFVMSDASHGRIVGTFPASEWFCADSRNVAPSIIAAMANMTGWTAGMTTHRAGETLIGLEASVLFLREVVADGRPIRAEARTRLDTGDLLVSETVVYDADDQVVATSKGLAVPIDNKRRRRAHRRASERALCTILFTDIVDSTKRAEALGDRAWHALLEQHNDVARREITRCMGLVVKSTGDGLLARFGSPTRALDCAVHLRDALGRLGIQIRAGLHTGECETTDDDIVGMAVNLAARIQATAAPGEVLVSSTVKDLAAGAGHRFENRGEHTLKGVEEPWRLWAVG
jgi:class 3 adenylate cyclase